MRYTLELRQIDQTHNVKIFDFEYDFYDNDLKKQFEKKFIEHYYFDEIGFETIGRFKQRLKSKLNLIAPYYKQLYVTELESKKVNFLLNKDLKEMFIREISENENFSNSNSSENTSTGTSTSTSNSNSNSNTIGVEKHIDTPTKTVLDFENYLTDATKSENNSNSSSEVTNDVVDKNMNINSMKGQGENEKEQIEKTELISQGNIGTTSTGQLLESWRKVLINIDMMIIEECEDLFMGVY